MNYYIYYHQELIAAFKYVDDARSFRNSKVSPGRYRITTVSGKDVKGTPD